MKNIITGLITILASVVSLAQTSFNYPKNEVKLNILNAIGFASIEVGYERFVGINQSLEAEFHFNDRFSYWPKGKNFHTNSVKVGYNYYFDLEGLSGPYANLFIKQRFGKYEEDTKITDMNSFILGLGIGYLWNYNDTFVVAPFVSIARNFSEAVNSRFYAIEPNAGIRIGIRF